MFLDYQFTLMFQGGILPTPRNKSFICLYHVDVAGHTVQSIDHSDADLFSVLRMDESKGLGRWLSASRYLATKPDNLSTILRIHMVGREAACPLTPTHTHPYIDTHRLTETTDTPPHTHTNNK